MLPEESLCTQMLKVEFNHCRLFHILPLCYDSNKTWAFLFQSAVAGSCCDSKWFLNAIEQDSLAFCHIQHIVGTHLHIPNSFTYDTWKHAFSPMPIHASNIDVSHKVLSTPKPSRHQYMLLDTDQSSFPLVVSVFIDEACGRKQKLLKISHRKLQN